MCRITGVDYILPNCSFLCCVSWFWLASPLPLSPFADTIDAFGWLSAHSLWLYGHLRTSCQLDTVPALWPHLAAFHSARNPILFTYSLPSPAYLDMAGLILSIWDCVTVWRCSGLAMPSGHCRPGQQSRACAVATLHPLPSHADRLGGYKGRHCQLAVSWPCPGCWDDLFVWSQGNYYRLSSHYHYSVRWPYPLNMVFIFFDLCRLFLLDFIGQHSDIGLANSDSLKPAKFTDLI